MLRGFLHKINKTLNAKEYIESGILESYVLGFASPEENAEVEQMLVQHPELQIEVEALRGTLEEYALAHAVAPPTGLRDKILGTLQDLSNLEKPTNAVAKVMPLNSPTASFWSRPWAVAASYTLLVLSIIGNVLVYNRWQTTEGKLATIESQNQVIAQDLTITKANYLAANQEVGLLRNPAIKSIELKGTPDSPTSSAVVYWNKDKSEVYLSALHLPAITAEQQYQLWAIIDGKPVDAGIFDINSNLLKLKDITNASAFAISLEARGGSTTQAGPKGKVYVMGGV